MAKQPCSHSDAALQRMIRKAEFPDKPDLINTWLTRTCHHSDAQRQFQFYQYQFQLLMETALDVLLPNYWRMSCLDQLYLPLSALNQLARSDDELLELRQLKQELSICGRYFAASFNPAAVTQEDTAAHVVGELYDRN